MAVEKTNIEIRDITIKIGDVDVRLSVEQAKSLQRILNDLLGDAKPLCLPWYPVYPTYPSYPSYPYWTVTTTGCTTIINEADTWAEFIEEKPAMGSTC